MFACRIGERREIDRRGRGEQARGVSPLACPPAPYALCPVIPIPKPVFAGGGGEGRMGGRVGEGGFGGRGQNK